MRSVGGPAADLTAHNLASISDSTPLLIGTYASGYPLEIVRRLRLAPEARVSRSSCQIGDVIS